MVALVLAAAAKFTFSNASMSMPSSPVWSYSSVLLHAQMMERTPPPRARARAHTHTPFPHACACRHNNHQTGQIQLSLTRAHHHRRYFDMGVGVCVPWFSEGVVLATSTSYSSPTLQARSCRTSAGEESVCRSACRTQATRCIYTAAFSISKRGGQWQRQRRRQRRQHD